MKTKKTINEQWSEKSKEIFTNYYSVTIGELINRYIKDKLIINPAYQRHYRWKNENKSRFIESLLLGYPIPPIFVYENLLTRDLEIIDGLQRLATIFEFTGNLKENILPLNQLHVLEKTKILTKLDGKSWDELEESGLQFVLENRTLQVVAVDSRNSLESKYEIFRRLNSSAVILSEQEIRNATMYEKSPEDYKLITDSIKEENFQFLGTIALQEQKYMELFIEYLLMASYIKKELSTELLNAINSSDFRDVLDMFSFTLDKKTLKTGLKSFNNFFEKYSAFQFKYYDKDKKTYTGQFINFFFELLAAIHILNPNQNLDNEFINNLLSKKYSFWQKNIIKKNNPPARMRMLAAIKYAETLEIDR